MTENTPQPTRELIKQAKAATLTHGPSLEDLTTGRARVDEARPLPIPPAIEALQQRLEGYIQQDGVKNAGESKAQEAPIDTSGLMLGDIHFHTFNEGPQEGIFNERKPKKYVSDADRKKRLQEQVTQIEDNESPESRYLRRYLSEFNRYYGGLKWEHNNNSEEYNAMSLLLVKSGLARTEPSYSSGQHQPELIYRAMTILRTPLQYSSYGGGVRLDTERGASWAGIGRSYNTNPEVYAREILKKAQETVGKDRQSGQYKFQPYDMDVCVMSALACGEVKTAIELIKLAPEFFPDQTDAVNNAFSRIQGIIQDARGVTPELARSIDEGLICLGEEGSYKELGGSSVAQGLKKQAEQNIRAAIKEGRDDWYLSKEVADMATREGLLSPESLQRLIEEAASKNENWTSVTEQIRQRAKEVVDGKAANLLAAELIRRMYPDLSIDDQLKTIRETFMGTATGSAPHMDTANRFNHVLARRNDVSFSEQSPRDKAETIRGTYFPGERQLVEMIYDPRSAPYISTLIAFLRYPDNLGFQMQEAFKNSSRDRGYGYDYTKDQDPRILEGRKQLAKRLVGGVTFLQSCAEDKEVRVLMEKEFGLGSSSSSLLNRDNLEKAQTALEKMFGDVADKESGLTLYESVLPDPDQQGEDGNVFKRLNAARENELVSLTQIKTKEAEGALQTSVSAREQDRQHMEGERTKRAEILVRQREVEQSIPRLKAELVDIEAMKVAGKLERLLGRGITEVEKATQIASKQAQIQAAQEALDTAATELKGSQEISDGAYRQMVDLVGSLQRLAQSIT